MWPCRCRIAVVIVIFVAHFFALRSARCLQTSEWLFSTPTKCWYMAEAIHLNARSPGNTLPQRNDNGTKQMFGMTAPCVCLCVSGGNFIPITFCFFRRAYEQCEHGGGKCDRTKCITDDWESGVEGEAAPKQQQQFSCRFFHRCCANETAIYSLHSFW